MYHAGTIRHHSGGLVSFTARSVGGRRNWLMTVLHHNTDLTMTYPAARSKGEVCDHLRSLRGADEDKLKTRCIRPMPAK